MLVGRLLVGHYVALLIVYAVRQRVVRSVERVERKKEVERVQWARWVERQGVVGREKELIPGAKKDRVGLKT